MRFSRSVALAAAAAIAASSYAGAFTTSSAGGRLIASGASRPVAISTTDGGVIVAGTQNQTFFLNRYSAEGLPVWDDGFAFPGADGIQLVSDGRGGAIVATHTPGLATLGIKRIVATGASTWEATLPAGQVIGSAGVAWSVSQSAGITLDAIDEDGAAGPHLVAGIGSGPVAVGDGLGGIFVAWRSGSLKNGVALMVQHATASGETWAIPADVAGASDPGFDPILAADSLGGVIVAWHAAGELWLVRVGPDGTIVYGPVLFQQKGAKAAAVAVDGADAYVVWAAADPARLRKSEQIVVTRIDLGGIAQTNVSLGSVPGGVLDLRAAADPAGVVVGWQQAQIAPWLDTDLYIQRVTRDGSRAWSDSRLATAIGIESFGSLFVAPTGEAIALFEQSICGRIDMQGLAMQRIAADGTRALTPSIACP